MEVFLATDGIDNELSKDDIGELLSIRLSNVCEVTLSSRKSYWVRKEYLGNDTCIIVANSKEDAINADAADAIRTIQEYIDNNLPN